MADPSNLYVLATSLRAVVAAKTNDYIRDAIAWLPQHKLDDGTRGEGDMNQILSFFLVSGVASFFVFCCFGFFFNVFCFTLIVIIIIIL